MHICADYNNYMCRSNSFADISLCVVASVTYLGATVRHRRSKPCVWENSDPTHMDSDFEKKFPQRSFHIKTVLSSPTTSPISQPTTSPSTSPTTVSSGSRIVLVSCHLHLRPVAPQHLLPARHQQAPHRPLAPRRHRPPVQAPRVRLLR